MVETAVHNDPDRAVKVAVVQAEPCWFNADAAVLKTTKLLAEAAASGAQLIAFPELWIPGYPNFLYAHDQKTCLEYMRRYYRNAIDVQSDHMQRIRAAARDAKIMVVIGTAERDRGSLYMAQTFIGSDGEVLLHRRKFKPTSWERVLFGDASGDCTTNVVQTPLGRVGGLQCFEHLQPLLKYHTYFQGEQIHVAAWPNLFPPVGNMPFFSSVETCVMATHTYAIESAAFVLLASSTQSEAGLRANGLVPNNAGINSEDSTRAHTAVIGGGFTRIIAPDGRTLASAPSAEWEGLVYADLSFDEIYMAKNIVDTVGQYSRPDLFQLKVNGEVRRQCVYEQGSKNAEGVNGWTRHEERFLPLPLGNGVENLEISERKGARETFGILKDASVVLQNGKSS